jgi:hypothetical protein
MDARVKPGHDTDVVGACLPAEASGTSCITDEQFHKNESGGPQAAAPSAIRLDNQF